MSDRVQIAAHAKANLLLRILAKEVNGYHGIETLFTLLELHDEITVERTDRGIELEVVGAETGPTEENLAYRAAAAVLQTTGGHFGVRVSLRKHVPVQAGLGGGSSDGAAVLHAVNRLAGDAVPRHEILQFAAKLGSDVAFFASGAALALAWGRGERLFRLPAPRASPVLIVIPPFGVSTAAAYRQFDVGQAQDRRRGAVVFDATVFDTWGGIGRLGGNDFESFVFAERPQLKQLYERVAETRPLLARLCGSGSAIIAVYKNEGDREGAALEIGERDQRLIKTMTRPQVAPGPV